MSEARVRSAFAEQAQWCERLGSPFTARLCALLAERLDGSSELGRRVLAWPGDPSPSADVLPLRLCGALHAAVRRGAAPELAACYPPNPTPPDHLIWDALRPVVERPELLPWLDLPPQTNEVGRSAVLMAGLLEAGRRFSCPVELLELGASAGLNLLLDRYGYDFRGHAAGNAASPLQLRPEWRGPPPPGVPVAVTARAGVDLQPLDPRRDAERLLAYVWPDQPHRLEQVELALAIAAADPPAVSIGDAAGWLRARLDVPQPDGRLRVVMHSLAYQYFTSETQAAVTAAIEAAGRAASAARPLAWLRFEKLPEEERYSLRLRLWPGGEERLLAWTHPHGRWIEWLA